MGQQVLFFADETDCGEFLEFATQYGCQALPRVISTEIAEHAIPPNRFFAVHDDRESANRCYLLPPNVRPVEAMYADATSAPGQYVIIASNSPVIEFLRPNLTDAAKPDGRIYFNQQPDDTTYLATAKAFNGLARFIRKWPKACLRYRRT